MRQPVSPTESGRRDAPPPAPPPPPALPCLAWRIAGGGLRIVGDWAALSHGRRAHRGLGRGYFVLGLHMGRNGQQRGEGTPMPPPYRPLLRRESSTRGWGGRVGCPPTGFGGEGGGLKNCETWGPQRGKSCSLRERETVVPLLTRAASAPWRPSHAGAGMGLAEFGGCSPPHLMREHRAQGFRVTKCCPWGGGGDCSHWPFA